LTVGNYQTVKNGFNTMFLLVSTLTLQRNKGVLAI